MHVDTFVFDKTEHWTTGVPRYPTPGMKEAMMRK